MPLCQDVVRASERPMWVDAWSDLVKIAKSDPLYWHVKSKIPYSISEIFEVRNAELYAKFLLKKEQYDNPEILELFHDTEIHNIESIMKTNLDWRCVVRAKYGNGVSFASDPTYAYFYSKGFNVKKAMIIADVLVDKKMTYNYGEFLHSDYDTTTCGDGNVFVKYCDDEFYPKYIVYYTGSADKLATDRRGQRW